MNAIEILLLLFCLAVALQAAASTEGMQDVGGAFGREWLERAVWSLQESTISSAGERGPGQSISEPG